ncbi:hypothetical protein D3C85_1535060 [compost metagenome]
MEVLAIQLAVGVEQNHPVVIDQHKGNLLAAVPDFQIAEDRFELPVLDLHHQNADILKKTKLLHQPDLCKYRLCSR